MLPSRGRDALALVDTAVRTGQIDKRFSPRLCGMLDILFPTCTCCLTRMARREAYSQLELALDMMQYGLCGKTEKP